MTKQTIATDECITNRRGSDRRISGNRRRLEAASSQTAVEHRKSERRKVERRRQIDPTTCEREYTPEQVEFMKAMDLYKRRSGRQFPTWSEVLEVLDNLGYRKVATPTEIYKQPVPVQPVP